MRGNRVPRVYRNLALGTDAEVSSEHAGTAFVVGHVSRSRDDVNMDMRMKGVLGELGEVRLCAVHKVWERTRDRRDQRAELGCFLRGEIGQRFDVAASDEHDPTRE